MAVLYFGLQLCIGLGTLISEASLRGFPSKFTMKSDYNCSYHHYGHWVYAFMSVGYILPKVLFY